MAGPENHSETLRTGWTTGTCATAAAVAAAQLLTTGESVEQVTIHLPSGEQVPLAVHTCDWHSDAQTATDQVWAGASVIKDGGDDIDVTHGLEICARVRRIPEPLVRILGGPGVGRVTRAGLSVPVGEWAINPVPREMLRAHLTPYMSEQGGIEVVISVSGGELAAEKTFNGRLGIVGGISIIGTSGRVVPMSEEAFKASLLVALKQAVALGHQELTFVFGNYGEAFALSQGVPETAILKMSNFVGFMLDEAAKLGVSRVALVGNIGKLVKVSSGSFHTHSYLSDGKFETLVAHLALMGAPRSLLEQVMHAATTEAVVTLLESWSQGAVDYSDLYRRLAHAAKEKCLQRVRHAFDVDIVLFSDQRRLLAMTPKATVQSTPATALAIESVPSGRSPIKVVGIGPGKLSLMTAEATQAITSAEVVIGAKRQLEMIAPLLAQGTVTHQVSGRPKEVVDLIHEHPEGTAVVVLASGDPLLFGIGDSLRRQFPKLEVINGISALQYIFAQIPVSMNDVYLTSCHGRDFDAKILQRHDKIALVTDQIWHPGAIAKALLGAPVTLYIGRDLGYPEQAVYSGRPELFADYSASGLHAVVIVKEKSDERP